MKISIYPTNDEMSLAAAKLIALQVKEKPSSLICFPSGESPAGVFRHLIEMVNNSSIDLSECYFVGLDEWVGLGAEDDGSCTKFLQENFFGPASIKEEKIYFFNAKAADLDAECEAMDAHIKKYGPLDVMMVGIGMNGHIGLNEPGTKFNLYANHSALDPVTVTVGQKYFKQETHLTGGITLGLKHLQEAKIPLLVASGKKKAEILQKALLGEITSQVPASIFQQLDNGVVLLDEEAASKLSQV